MNGRHVHLLMVGPALLAGCTVGSDCVRPANAALGVPAAFGEPAPTARADDVAPDWWMRFSDPVPGQLVATAVADNTDIAGAVAHLRSARALAREAPRSGRLRLSQKDAILGISQRFSRPSHPWKMRSRLRPNFSAANCCT